MWFGSLKLNISKNFNTYCFIFRIGDFNLINGKWDREGFSYGGGYTPLLNPPRWGHPPCVRPWKNILHTVYVKHQIPWFEKEKSQFIIQFIEIFLFDSYVINNLELYSFEVKRFVVWRKDLVENYFSWNHKKFKPRFR